MYLTLIVSRSCLIVLIATALTSGGSAIAQEHADLCIDAGHGGREPGALTYLSPSFSEKDINLKVVNAMARYLSWLDPTAKYTRLSDSTLELPQRAHIAMLCGAKAFISVHHNAIDSNPLNGCVNQRTECLYYGRPTMDPADMECIDSNWWGLPRYYHDSLARKISYSLRDEFRYETVRLIDDYHMTILDCSSMASTITEACAIDSGCFDDIVFNYYWSDGLAELEAHAILTGYHSWTTGQGIAKVDYGYVGQDTIADTLRVWVDDLYLRVPYYTCWEPSEWHTLQAWDAFSLQKNLKSYLYTFHHWEKLDIFGLDTIPSEQTFNPVATLQVHWDRNGLHNYRAFYKGGPYQVSFHADNQWVEKKLGQVDTIRFVPDSGVMNSTNVIIALSRVGSGTWQTIDTVPWNYNQWGEFWWTISLPEGGFFMYRLIAFDKVDNQDTAFSPPFHIWDSTLDRDHDWVFNQYDNCPDYYNPYQDNSDGDSFGDACDNCDSVANSSQGNQDSDWWGDACDLCPTAYSHNNIDSDADGKGDDCDNCSWVPNANQLDSDSDGWGDLCDNCPYNSNPSQLDSDHDGIGDVCDVCVTPVASYDIDTVSMNANSVTLFLRCTDTLHTSVAWHFGNWISAKRTDTTTRRYFGGLHATRLFVSNPCGRDSTIIPIHSCNIPGVPVDRDADGWNDICDNCPYVYNPDQADATVDLIGDACCCQGLAGNVDGDVADEVDISDLSALIDYLYISLTPRSCMAEANCDGSTDGWEYGEVDISDLSVLIDFLYINFTPPSVCVN